MDDRQLQSFFKVAELGSFSKASELLYISKVSVMKQISSLEEEIDIKLFNRSTHGSELTPAGRSFYEEMKDILHLRDKAIQNAQKIGKTENNTIRIGTSILRPCNYLLDLWQKIRTTTELPEIRFEIIPFDDNATIQNPSLESFDDKFDCFLSACDSTKWQHSANILILKNLPCRIAVPLKNTLSKKDKLEWSDLKNETFMLMQDGDSPVLNQMKEEILKNHPQIKLVDAEHKYDLNTFNRCAKEGYLMESLEIWENVHPTLRTLPMDWKYEIPFGIIYSQTPSPILQTFISTIQEYIQ
ncbi:LysR family transcriptional regulator [Streptococcus equinus]|uniref:LysR family transcriptional regulator n=1 Tax=Streptococcus equinus TaxID=1335 RepID=UPI003BF85184